MKNMKAIFFVQMEQVNFSKTLLSAKILLISVADPDPDPPGSEIFA